MSVFVFMRVGGCVKERVRESKDNLVNVFWVHSMEGRFSQTFVIKARVFRDRERKYEKVGERGAIATELSHFLSVGGSSIGCNGWFKSERMNVVALENGMEAVKDQYQMKSERSWARISPGNGSD